MPTLLSDLSLPDMFFTRKQQEIRERMRLRTAHINVDTDLESTSSAS